MGDVRWACRYCPLEITMHTQAEKAALQVSHPCPNKRKYRVNLVEVTDEG